MEKQTENERLFPYALSVDLKGRVAIVTGAARGIGKAVAEALSRCGAHVLALDQMRVEDAKEADAPKNIFSKTTDISRPAEIDEAVNFCLQTLGGPDILVNAAGISMPCRVSEMPPEIWQRAIDVNLQPVYFLSRAVMPHMLKRESGSIIFFSSMIAGTGGETSAHYTAAKGGVEGFCRSLAREVGPGGVRVNAIAPGMIDTPMLDLMPESQKKKLARRIPLRRIGIPLDLVGIVLFLVSSEASYITGQTIHVNGGMYMG